LVRNGRERKGGYRGEAADESMNWRRGLLRLWISVSVLWVIVCPLLVRPNAISLDCAMKRAGTDLWCETLGRADIDRLLIWMASVPLLSLAAGIAIIWTIRGFRSG
jgi:hypothetical protein